MNFVGLTRDEILQIHYEHGYMHIGLWTIANHSDTWDKEMIVELAKKTLERIKTELPFKPKGGKA